jgi:hypothetical protein
MEVEAPPARPSGAISSLPLGTVAAAGLVGSALVALAAWSTGVFPRRGQAGTWTIVPFTLPRGVGWLAWVLGIGLLSVAWVALHRRALGAPASLTVGRVALIALLWALPLVLAPPVGSRDVYSYAAHGELSSRGIDPGESPPWALDVGSPYRSGVDPLWRGVVSAYGPASTGVAELTVEATGHDVTRTIIGLRLWMMVGVALMGAGVVVLARRTGRSPVDALVLAVAGPLTIVHLVGGVHNEALMAGFMMLGLAVAAAWPGATGAVLGAGLVAVGGAVKVPALAAVVYLGWRYDGRPASLWVRGARVLGLLGVALVVMQALHIATGLSWGWTSGLTAGSSVTTLLSLSTMLGLLIRWLFVPLGVDRQTTLDAVRQVLQLAGFAVAAVLLWRTPVLGLAGLGGALFVLALLGPSVHAWYFAWALPVLAVAWAGSTAPALVVGSILLAASTRPDGGGLLRNLGFYPWLLLPVLAVVAVAVWRRRNQEREPIDLSRG